MPQRGEAPTGVLRSLAAVRRRTLTDLLGEVKPFTKRQPLMAGGLFYLFFYQLRKQLLNKLK